MTFTKQWRVEIFRDEDTQRAIGATLITFGEGEGKWFDDPEDLPEWVKERIAVLKVMGQGSCVSGVSTDESNTLADVYWIDVPE